MTDLASTPAVRDLAQAFREDGVVKLSGVLDARGLDLLRKGFEWSVANPSSAAQSYFPETGATFYQDLFNTRSWPVYEPVLRDTALSAIAAEVLDTKDLWFFFEQVFLKEGGEARRTPWHQDSSYFPIDGGQLAVMWMCLDPVSREDSLEFVRGSHRGTLFNGSAFNAADDTLPLYDEAYLPRLPDIEANRSAFDIVSWAVEPGDALFFHPGVLHGGAPTHPGGRRRTVSLRFFGDDVIFVERPGVRADSEVGFNREAGDSRDISEFYEGLKPGDRFRNPGFLHLRGA